MRRSKLETFVGGEMNKDSVLLFKGDVLVEQPQKSIKVKSLVPLQDIKSVKFFMSVEANKKPNLNGNDNMAIYFGDIGISYGRLTDPTNSKDILGKVERFGDDSLFEKGESYNSIMYNSSNLFCGKSYKPSLPDYENIEISTFTEPYQGKIKLEAYGYF